MEDVTLELDGSPGWGTTGKLTFEDSFFRDRAPSLDISRLGLHPIWRDDWDDKLKEARSPARYRAHLSTLAEAMRLTPGSSVLDIGCGVAAEAIEYACVGARCVGLDAAADPVRLHTLLKRTFGLDAFIPLRGDAAALPFGDASFDAVLSVHSLEHIADPDGAVAEAIRVLRSGGRLVVLQASLWNPVVFAGIWWHDGFRWLLTKHLVLRNAYGDGCYQKNEDLHGSAWWRMRMATFRGIRLVRFEKFTTTPGLAGALIRPMLGHFLIVAEKR